MPHLPFCFDCPQCVLLIVACMTCCLIANALSRCEDMSDVVVVCLFVHVTVAWLSQKMPMCVCFRLLLTIFSRISQDNRTPVISKSFIDIVPLGFFFDTRLLWMSFGHSILQTYWCGSCLLPLVQTPPTAVPEASTYPI